MSTRPAPRSVLATSRHLQVVLGVIWLGDGLLQLQPKMFGPGFVSGVLAPAASGQPGIVGWFLGHADHLVSARMAAFNAVFATVQILIGVGLLYRDTAKAALVTSVAWSLGVWSMGEGLRDDLHRSGLPADRGPGRGAALWSAGCPGLAPAGRQLRRL